MESQVAMFKTMMSDVDVTQSEIKVDPFYCLEIEREHLLKQALEKIKEADPKDLRKRLRVSFDGEEGLDAGGVTKEVSLHAHASSYAITLIAAQLTSFALR